MFSSSKIKMMLPLLVIFIVAILPTPEGLSVNAHYFFAVFLGVIVGLILEPIPAAKATPAKNAKRTAAIIFL